MAFARPFHLSGETLMDFARVLEYNFRKGGKGTKIAILSKCRYVEALEYKKYITIQLTNFA